MTHRCVSTLLCRAGLPFMGGALALLLAAHSAPAQSSVEPSSSGQATGVTTQLHVGGATIAIEFAPGPLDLPQAAILKHIDAAAQAVTVYFGRFPVNSARILVNPISGGHG